MGRSKTVACVLFCFAVTGCAMTSVAPNFNGLKYVDGSVPVHINLTKWAVHFAFVR